MSFESGEMVGREKCTGCNGQGSIDNGKTMADPNFYGWQKCDPCEGRGMILNGGKPQ